jgi:hypothetical protein
MMTNDHSHPDTHRPWQLVVLLPNAQHHTIAQFRNRQDAEDHLRTIQQLAPNAQFALLFIPHEDSESSEP